MPQVMTAAVRPSTCPYEIGAPIDLHHLLALPPDGRNYTRDARGRLVLMSPDDWRQHGHPIVVLTEWLHARLKRPYRVLHERAIALPRIYDLRGRLLPESFLGPKAIEPDVAVYARTPDALAGPHGLTFAAAEGILLVIEVLSPGTWCSDLGAGEADEVDRPRSYLESGVPEYWVLNAGVDDPACPLAAREGRFLGRFGAGAAARWEPLPREGDRVRSRALSDLSFDLAAFWRDCEL